MKGLNRLIPLLMVMAAVVLNIASAILLKILANHNTFTVFALSAGLSTAVILNGLRFSVWGFLHKKYPLSLSYPLSSVFYPMMLFVSIYYGESVNPRQIAGTILITCGVLWMTLRVKL